MENLWGKKEKEEGMARKKMCGADAGWWKGIGLEANGSGIIYRVWAMYPEDTFSPPSKIPM